MSLVVTLKCCEASDSIQFGRRVQENQIMGKLG